MVQTLSQYKTKGVKALAVQKASTPSNKGEKEMKPIIVDDTLIVVDMDGMLGVNSQPQCTKAKFPCNLTTPEINQTYSQPVIRLPPRSPDLNDRENPRINTGMNSNLDFEENSPHQEGIITEMYVSPDQSYIEQVQELTDLLDSKKLVKNIY